MAIFIIIFLIIPFFSIERIFTLIGIHSNDNYPKTIYIKIPKEEKILENEIINKLNCSIITKDNSNDDFLSCSNRVISNLGSFIIFEDREEKPFAIPKKYIIGFEYKTSEVNLDSLSQINFHLKSTKDKKEIEKIENLILNQMKCKKEKKIFICKNIVKISINPNELCVKYIFDKNNKINIECFKKLNNIFKKIEINLKEN